MGAKFKEFIIGKSPSSDYQIKGDKTVSRTHAKIFVNEENEVFITDLDSTNGTFINGKKLKKGSGQKLSRQFYGHMQCRKFLNLIIKFLLILMVKAL